MGRGMRICRSFEWRQEGLGLDAADGSGGEREEGGDEVEGAADDDSDETEGEQDEPDEGIENDCGHGDGPADDEENEEEEKLDHGGVTLWSDLRIVWRESSGG